MTRARLVGVALLAGSIGLGSLLGCGGPLKTVAQNQASQDAGARTTSDAGTDAGSTLVPAGADAGASASGTAAATGTGMFARGSAVLASGSDAVESVVRDLQYGDATMVEVEGFASSDEPDALKLSLRRAQAFRDALVGNGVPRAHIRVRGFGTGCAIAGKGRGPWENRRVVTVVVATRDGANHDEGCTAKSVSE